MRYRIADLVFDSSEPLPELTEATQTPEVSVEWVDQLSVANVRWFHAWPTPDGDDWVRFGRRAGSFVLEFPDHARFVLSGDAARVAIAPIGRVPPETLRHLLLNQVLPLVLSRRGRLVLHGSAVSFHGAVIACVGPTDAGKSTLAAACCGAGALHVTDDALVLVASDDEQRWLAVPSYSGLRLWQATADLLGWTPRGEPISHYSPKLRLGPDDCPIAFETASLPLTRVLLLESARGGASTVEALSGHRAVLSIATHLFRLDVEDARETVRLFDVLTRIIPSIDVRRFASDMPMEAASLALPDLFPSRE